MIGVALNVKIPGLDTNAPDLATYLEAIFSFLVWGTIILAMLMIIIGGFYYLSSAGNASRASEGKDRIKWAILGLVLALSSYVILSFINPDLVRPKLPGLTSKLSGEGYDMIDALGIPSADNEKGLVEKNGECKTDKACGLSLKCKPAPERYTYRCEKTGEKYYGQGQQALCKTECEDQKCLELNTSIKTCQLVTPADNPEGKILYGQTCNPQSDTCYDQEKGIICHKYYGDCMPLSEPGLACIDENDCTTNICENRTCIASKEPEEAPPSEEKSEPSEFSISRPELLLSEEAGIIKDNRIYSLYKIPFAWMPQEAKGKNHESVSIAMCNNKNIKVPNPKLIGHDTTMIIPKEGLFSVGWTEIGLRTYQKTGDAEDTIRPVECSLNYGSSFENEGEKWCDSGDENRKLIPIPGKHLTSGQEKNNCCVARFYCVAPKLGPQTCQDLSNNQSDYKAYNYNKIEDVYNEVTGKDLRIDLGIDEALTETHPYNYLIACSRPVPPPPIQITFPKHKKCEYSQTRGIEIKDEDLDKYGSPKEIACDNMCVRAGEQSGSYENKCCVCLGGTRIDLPEL